MKKHVRRRKQIKGLLMKKRSKKEQLKLESILIRLGRQRTFEHEMFLAEHVEGWLPF